MGGSGSSVGPTRPRKKSTRQVGGGVPGKAVSGDICRTIDESQRLQSPKPGVIKSLKPGDVLQLRAKGGKPPILAVTSDGDVAGSVVPSSLDTLLKCMKKRHKYKATVESVKGGICVVRITPS